MEEKPGGMRENNKSNKFYSHMIYVDNRLSRDSNPDHSGESFCLLMCER